MLGSDHLRDQLVVKWFYRVLPRSESIAPNLELQLNWRRVNGWKIAGVVDTMLGFVTTFMVFVAMKVVSG